MSSIWQIIESRLSLLPEEKMYRGETLVRMKDLRALFKELGRKDEKTGKAKSYDPQVGDEPDPEGGMVTCSYAVDPRAWGRWNPSIKVAGVFAGTDKKDTQHLGDPKGGMMVKKNYGGRINYQAGPHGREVEALPSAMDRYDVLMVADISGLAEPGQPLNWPPNLRDGMPSIVVRRIAWSPAIGTADERQARLEMLLQGKQVPPLSRRPQPEVPEPPKDSAQPPAENQGSKDWMNTPSAGYRTGQGSQARQGTYQRSPWYKPGRGLGKDERED